MSGTLTVDEEVMPPRTQADDNLEPGDKYWWICLMKGPGGLRNLQECTCIGPTPFEHVKEEEEEGENVVIINWKEMTKEEYDTWVRLFAPVEETTKA